MHLLRTASTRWRTLRSSYKAGGAVVVAALALIAFGAAGALPGLAGGSRHRPLSVEASDDPIAGVPAGERARAGLRHAVGSRAGGDGAAQNPGAFGGPLGAVPSVPGASDGSGSGPALVPGLPAALPGAPASPVGSMTPPSPVPTPPLPVSVPTLPDL